MIKLGYLIQKMKQKITKNCITCNEEIIKSYETLLDWKNRKFCSMECRKGTIRTEDEKRRIKETCLAKGTGKWKRGARSQELKDRQSEAMKTRVALGIHNFWKGGRPQKYCPDCNAPVTYYRTKCVKCAPARGENHPNWQGGITPINHKIRNSLESKAWIKSVKLRDGHKCKIGNKDCSGKLEAHHILSWSEYPELRYQINNGITLCHFHHPRAGSVVIRI